jgi:hypothetical protein
MIAADIMKINNAFIVFGADLFCAISHIASIAACDCNLS